jgi:hypothetical protein
MSREKRFGGQDLGEFWGEISRRQREGATRAKGPASSKLSSGKRNGGGALQAASWVQPEVNTNVSE